MYKYFSLFCVFLILSGKPIQSQSIVPVNNVKQWMEQRFAKGVVPPFSFVYGGKKSESFIKNWEYKAEKMTSTEPDKEVYVYSYTDKATGLLVKCTVTCFTDFPSLEWVLHFSNTSGKNTPLIEKVAAVDHSFSAGEDGTGNVGSFSLQLVRQTHGTLKFDQSCMSTPLRIGSRSFAKGLGTHSNSEIRVTFPEPVTKFTSFVGIDNNYDTGGVRGSVQFAVVAGNKELLRTQTVRGSDEARVIDLALPEKTTSLTLIVNDAADGQSHDHADWCEPVATGVSGTIYQLSDAASFSLNPAFILHHARGSGATRADFMPIDAEMSIGKKFYMTSTPTGRSSSGAAFPFFNINMSGKQGIMVAVGWTGDWYADIVQNDAKTVALKSGMEKMQLALYPKEEIRSPKICLLFWQGEDRMVGHNRFRQFILAHHSRKINGQFAEYPLCALFRMGDDEPCGEFECTTEEYLLAIVRHYKQYNIMPDAFWLDAGWYEGCGWGKPNGGWWSNVGNWTPAMDRFPNGLRPVADAIHEAGSKLLVWFEPERVYSNTMIHREYPQWLLKTPTSGNTHLFDLGNKEARIWLTDHITEIIKKEGIDYYRQDFNMDPHPYWTAKDQPGRIGMSEIRYIEGLYAFWDSLLVRFPDLLIDNCASGGRRIDLETTSRSAPLWRTDYAYGEPNGQQCHTYGLNFYLPVHATGIHPTDDYNFRSGLSSAMMGLNWLKGRGPGTVESSRKYMQDFRSLRPYFYGDYYPLTPAVNHTGDNVWLAYQLNRPSEKDGIIIAFRRAANQQNSIRIKPSGLEKDAVYELFYEEYGIRTQHKGSELMNGFDITIPAKPATLLIKYGQIKN